MNRRTFIRTGLIYVPTIFACHGGSVRMGHLDSEVGDWMTRARNGGGNYTSAAVVASDAAMKMVKAAGLRTKLLRCNLFCGDRNGSLAPLIKDAGAATDNAFAGSSYSEALGWSMNAGTEYISTGFNPSLSLTTNDAHLSLYLGGTAGQATWIPMGIAAATNFFLLGAYTGVGTGAPIWASPYPTASDSDGIGFYLASRTSSAATGVKVYKNGSLTATSSSVGGSPPNETVMVLNCNTGGVTPLGGAPNNKYGRAYTLGTGLTDANVLDLYNAIQRSQTILGRQV